MSLAYNKFLSARINSTYVFSKCAYCSQRNINVTFSKRRAVIPLTIKTFLVTFSLCASFLYVFIYYTIYILVSYVFLDTCCLKVEGFA